MFKKEGPKYWLFAILASVLAASPILSAHAAEEAPRCLIVHVTQDNPKSWKQALNIVSNVPKQLDGQISIELVAQGPGLTLITDKSPEAERVRSLIIEGEANLYPSTFSACGTTMKNIAKKKGKEPVLLEGVNRVPGGIVRVIELHEKGCTYVRP